MKVGDLVRDEFGNLGVVVGTANFSNGPAVEVRFSPNAGYSESPAWVLESILEVVSDEHSTSDIANDPIDW